MSWRVPYPRDATVSGLFRAVAEERPTAIAVEWPAHADSASVQLSYAELSRQSDALAVKLTALGVRAGDRVVLFTERSLAHVVATLAILKCGASYVPLDPAYPTDRLAYMVGAVDARCVLTEPALLPRLPQLPLPVHELPALLAAAATETAAFEPAVVTADSVAYIMFTSGSTGRPKGVMVPHRGIVRLVRGSTFTPLNAERTFLQLAPVSFDAATLELWGPLLNGGRCVLFPGGSIPDPALLARVLREARVNSLWLTASLFNTLVSEQPSALEPIEELLTGGEALSVAHVRLAQQRLPRVQLVNGYGPTESTTFTTCHRIPRPVPESWTNVPIGTAIANTEVLIVGADGLPVSDGTEGELLVGGDGLALGYVGQPELTAERFVAHPLEPARLVYRTGDRVRRLEDGTIDFLGRVDDQVKLRGFRIELGEIIATLRAHPAVDDATVLLREDVAGQKRLVAYLSARHDVAAGPAAAVPSSDGVPAAVPPSDAVLDAWLRERLAEYMVPSAFVWLPRLPVNANGKVDRAALPAPESARVDTGPIAEPATATERLLASTWQELLGHGPISVEANFFDVGGTSLLAIRLVARLQAQHGLALPLVGFFQRPTIRGSAALLDGALDGPLDGPVDAAPKQAPRSTTGGAIALVGVAGRFPGANNPYELWRLLVEERATSRRFERSELDASVPAEDAAHPAYVPVRGVVEDAEDFDHEYFGMPKREAEVTDPQHRVFLEVCVEALEDAAIDPARFPGAIGVYAGSGEETYLHRHLLPRPELVESVGAFTVRLGNEKDFLTTRLSYRLNLSGPSVTINTACSTSLVAIAHAMGALQRGECDAALAGGVSITTPQSSGYLATEGGMLAPDGQCRPFDAEAAGTLFNNGAAVVVLRRLEDALRDGDRVIAVLRGAGLNNDGSQRASFSAPSVDGQRVAIERAHQAADVSPASISFVECHGTATPVGDPIEVHALAAAFRRSEEPLAPSSVALGSVKGNVGHLVSAAGATGLIKAAFALAHGFIPGTLHYQRPNPLLELERTPFFVTGRGQRWDHGQRPRRAGVSSFGVGGTNAHVVLEEAPPLPARASSGWSVQLLPVSGRTEAALHANSERLADALGADALGANASGNDSERSLADVAHTLAVGRRQLAQRRAVVAGSCAEAVTLLRARSAEPPTTRRASVAFLFPGQGSQYLRMGAELLGRSRVFTEAMERCSTLMAPTLGASLLELLHPESCDAAQATELLTHTRFTQPALFAVEYALAQLWLSWGVRPVTMVGHSVGELVCACLASVLSLEDAAELVVLRGKLVGEQPRGSMLAVRTPAADILPLLGPELELAAVNSPQLCVVAGPSEPLAIFEALLTEMKVGTRRLHTSHAFHSAAMDPVVEPFTRMVAERVLSAPKIPFISTVSGLPITDQQATDPAYWGSHLRRTVRFADGIAQLLAHPAEPLLLEVGPRQACTTFARQAGAPKARVVGPSLPDRASESTEEALEQRTLLAAAGTLWERGAPIDLAAIGADEVRRKVPLPTTAFQRSRCFIPAAVRTLAEQPASNGAVAAHASNGAVRTPSMAATPTVGASNGAAESATAAPSAVTAPSTLSADVVADVDDELAAVVQAQLALMQAQLELLS